MQMTTNYSLNKNGGKIMKKELTPTEVKRVKDLMQVWDHLYKNKEWGLCDIISYEIGYIKGMVKEEEDIL